MTQLSFHLAPGESPHVTDNAAKFNVGWELEFATAAQRGTLAAWLGMALMTCGWYIKARMEEGFLREQLAAEEYSSYMRRVPMLIPFL